MKAAVSSMLVSHTGASQSRELLTVIDVEYDRSRQDLLYRLVVAHRDALVARARG